MSESVTENDFNENNGIVVASEADHEKYLTFLSDELVYGVSTDYVTEIITDLTITALPIVPDYVKGIINLRGQVIPIIDIRLRMYKPEAEYTSNTCIIVLDIGSVFIGIVVDTVLQVVDINKEGISPVPNASSQELVNGMCSLPSGVVLFLDCDLLIQS